MERPKKNSLPKSNQTKIGQARDQAPIFKLKLWGEPEKKVYSEATDRPNTKDRQKAF
jgi:hypothetical protein